MRIDQIEQLKALEEKLVDVYLTEADPDLWEGSNVPIEEWTKEIRGNRYWSKKNGVATVALAMRTKDLLDKALRTNVIKQAEVEEEAELDNEITAAMKEADKLMNLLTNKEARKQFLDKAKANAGS